MEQLASNDFSEISNVNKKNLDELVSLVEELVINKVRIEKMKSELSNNTHIKILDQELRIISEIQASIKKVKLIKIKTIANSLTDLINKCCIEYNIQADFIFEGQETEIDNSLTTYIKNILIYLIKDICENEFIAQKNTSNQIKVSACSDGKNLTTVIESNGRGFNYEDICKKLNKENLDLLSFSGDEIKEFFKIINFTNNIEEFFNLKLDLIYLDGSLKFESKANEFRRITIVIPLSSSIMKGLLVTIGNQTFAIPLDFIETIINKNEVKIKTSHKTEMIIYMDNVIQLISVSELLKIEKTVEHSCILIVSANNKRAGLLVDSILDQTDMVIKPKHSIIMNINEIKGSTILGDGLVTLVLNIPSILKEI
ncbi:chemotaxis protein CheW [Clostridium sp.]